MIRLGTTDLEVSRICFGCWQLSPSFWGDVPLPDWQQAVRQASDLGVNFIDTADAYGDGYAETCLGELMHKENLRDRFVLATKFYWNFEQEPRHPDTRPEYIRRACEASLRRLQTDRIDLYQIHSWDPLLRPAEVGATLRELQQEGKIRWIGVSNFNAGQIRLAREFFDVQCLQPCYNLLERGVEAHELPVCLEKQIGVIVYSPLARGLLTGKYKPDHKFGDHRDQADLYHGEPFRKMLEGLEQLRPIADRHGLTLAQLAIRWVLTQPAVSCAIVGVKKPAHLETIVKAADDALPQGDWHQVARIMAEAKQEAETLVKG